MFTSLSTWVPKCQKCRKMGTAQRTLRTVRLRKARGAFQNLTKLKNTRGVGKKTKIKLYKTLVRSVLLYGCETWKITKGEEKKLDAFKFKCLRRILRIRWPMRVSNERITKMPHVNRIGDGHILRGERSSDCMVALGWQPEGKRAVGRPKSAWRRTVEVQRRQAGWNDWGTARAIARYRMA